MMITATCDDLEEAEISSLELDLITVSLHPAIGRGPAAAPTEVLSG